MPTTPTVIEAEAEKPPFVPLLPLERWLVWRWSEISEGWILETNSVVPKRAEECAQKYLSQGRHVRIVHIVEKVVDGD